MKKIVSLLLSAAMVLSLGVNVFASSDTNSNATVTADHNLVYDETNGWYCTVEHAGGGNCKGKFDNGTLIDGDWNVEPQSERVYLQLGDDSNGKAVRFSFGSVPRTIGGLQVEIYNAINSTIVSGTFDCVVYNSGTISGGTFTRPMLDGSAAVENWGTITDGIFKEFVNNIEDGTISGGIFKGDIQNDGTINGGIFEEFVNNIEDGTISGGIFKGDVQNNGTINGGSFACVSYDSDCVIFETTENTLTIDKLEIWCQYVNGDGDKVELGVLKGYSDNIMVIHFCDPDTLRCLYCGGTCGVNFEHHWVEFKGKYLCEFCGTPKPVPTPDTEDADYDYNDEEEEEPEYKAKIDRSSKSNGTVKVDSKTATRGEKVTITVTPDEGYELASLTVLDEDGNERKLTDNGDGTYSFRMPEGGVTISAQFVKEGAAVVVPDGVKENPSTGASDFAGAAVALAVLSAAGLAVLNIKK